MKDGELKTGECFSNAKDSQSAKADAISKLANLGFTSIEIIAIEQGDPASRGTPNVSNVGDVKIPEFTNFMDKPEVEDVSVEIDEKEEKKSDDKSDSEETEEDSDDEKKEDSEDDSEDKEKSEDDEDEKSEKKKITEDLKEEWETSGPFFSEQGELIRKIPDECVNDCVVPGHDATAACSRWVEALNFKEGLDIPMAKAYLKSLGAWTENEIRALSDTEVAEMILWVVCGDIVDGQTLITIGDEGRFEESNVTEEKDETEETSETEETEKETTEEEPSNDPLISDVKDETSEEETEDSDGSEKETKKETEEETVEEEPEEEPSEEEDKTEKTPEETPAENSEKPEEKEDSKEDEPKDGELSKAEVLEMVEKFVNNWKQTLKNMDKASFKDLTIKERSKFFKDLDDQWEDKEHDPSDFISEKNWEMLMDLEIVL